MIDAIGQAFSNPITVVAFLAVNGATLFMAGIWLERQRAKFVTREECAGMATREELTKTENTLMAFLKDVLAQVRAIGQEVAEKQNIQDIKVHEHLKETRADIGRVFERAEKISQDVAGLNGRVDALASRLKELRRAG